MQALVRRCLCASRRRHQQGISFTELQRLSQAVSETWAPTIFQDKRCEHHHAWVSKCYRNEQLHPLHYLKTMAWADARELCCPCHKRAQIRRRNISDALFYCITNVSQLTIMPTVISDHLLPFNRLHQITKTDSLSLVTWNKKYECLSILSP